MDGAPSRARPAPIRAFRPDLLIISAGFDAANHDVGNAGVDRADDAFRPSIIQPDDYEEMTARLCRVAASSAPRWYAVGGWLRTPVLRNPAEGAAGHVPGTVWPRASCGTCARSRLVPLA